MTYNELFYQSLVIEAARLALERMKKSGEVIIHRDQDDTLCSHDDKARSLAVNFAAHPSSAISVEAIGDIHIKISSRSDKTVNRFEDIAPHKNPNPMEIILTNDGQPIRNLTTHYYSFSIESLIRNALTPA